MTTREFHYQDGASSKFWRIEREGGDVTVQFGRLGSAGQTQTKSFPDERAARQAYDKQIAEKLKKGYQETSAGQMQVSVPPQPPQVIAAPAELLLSDAAASVEALPPPIVASSDEPQIALEPSDWLWATWRDLPPLDRPASPAFDQAEALRRLARVANDIHRWGWNWDRAQITTAPSREEAHFWLTAMAPDSDVRQTPKQLAAALADQQFDGNLSCEQAFALVDITSRSTHPIVMALIAALCTPAEMLAYIVRQLAIPNSPYHGHRQGVAALLDGVRQYVLPYLDPQQRAQLGQAITAPLDPSQWPSDYYKAGPPAFYLAALFGGHDAALRALVESWADDHYSKESWLDYHQRPQELVFGLADPRLVEMHARRLKLRLNKPVYIRAWLAHTEFSALDVARDSILVEQNKERTAELLNAFACAIGPAVAPHMLELMRDSRAPQLARDWLEAHPQHTIAGLLPLADARGKLTDAAIELLRRFARRGYADAIADALAALPAESAARLRTSILDAALDQRPPLDDSTTPDWLREALAAQPYTKLAKPAAWVQASDLPAVLLGDHRLGDAQIEALLGALQRSKLDTPHPLATALRAHADAASLDRFAWALFEHWLVAGAPSKENWALFGLGLLGGDATALKLAALVRVWPGESQHQRAVAGLECLRAIGSDTALMQISNIAQKVKFKALQARAAECMEQIAKGRGLSRAQLEDRVIADCELDARGERLFDFGPRQFRFALGPDMKPMIRDEQGKLKTDLPKPGAKDDAGRAAQALADWKLLKKQVAEVAKVQAHRLEQAMVTGRRWSRDEFETLLVRHPLMTHLVRTLIWGAYDSAGARAATFRVTEDQSYANSQDETFDLAPFATVGLVHPLHLPQSDQSTWGEVLSDYAIIAPFPQLGRPVHHLEPNEQAATEITRFNQLTIPAASLVFGLEKLGWVRDSPADGGGFRGHSKPFEQANLTAVVQYEAGAGIGYIVEAPDQRLSYLAFVPGIQPPTWWPTHKDRLPLGEVDPLVLSEALGDLIVVMAKGV